MNTPHAQWYLFQFPWRRFDAYMRLRGEKVTMHVEQIFCQTTVYFSATSTRSPYEVAPMNWLYLWSHRPLVDGVNP